MRALILIGCLALAACGSGEESTTIGGTTYASNEREGTASITTDKGTISTVDGAAAANVDMPAFAPRYPGSTIVSAIQSQTAERTSHMVNIETSDSVDKVAAFYEKAFADAGLSVTSRMMTAEGGLMGAEGAGKKASIAVSVDEGKTMAVVSYSGG